jgi:hypothetical protein
MKIYWKAVKYRVIKVFEGIKKILLIAVSSNKFEE